MRAKMFKGTALVVSNSDKFRRPLQSALNRSGYSIRLVESQEAALRELQSLNPTMVIVDRMQSGFAQLHHVLPAHTPILAVSSHPGLCDEHHCVLDIEDGATRAVCNAGPLVIVALADAVLRRQRWQQPASDYFASEDVTIDFASHEVKVGATIVTVTPTQFRILRSLVVAPGHFLPRQALLDQVWGEGFAICPHTLDVNLSSLRRTLQSNGTCHDLIMTIKGVGFKLRSGSRLRAMASRSAASTAPPAPRPAIGTFSDSGRVPDAFPPSAAIWRTPTARPMSARYRKKPRPYETKHTASSHLGNHSAVTDLACGNINP